MTSDLSDRLNRHNSGYEKTTRPYAPFELIFRIEKSTRAEAREEEKRLKTSSGKRYLRSLIK